MFNILHVTYSFQSSLIYYPWITQQTKSNSLFELFKRVIVNFGDYFCYIHIFSAELLICSQTFVNLRQHLFIDNRQQTLYWLFTQTKLSIIYRNKPIVTYTCIGSWWNVKRCLQFKRNSNLQYFFYFSVARSSKACGKRRKTLKSWAEYIQVYLVFCCVMEKLLILYICEN